MIERPWILMTPHLMKLLPLDLRLIRDLTLIGILWLLFGVNPTGAVTATAEGTLTLVTEPTATNIYVDGLLRANITPLILKLAVGKHELDIKKAGKQPESLAVEIRAGQVVSKRVTLVDLPTKQSPVQEINLLKLLNPLRGYLETTAEFIRRRQQLIESLNQSVQQRNSSYQAGIATLEKDSYNAITGTLPVTIEWFDWTQRFNLAEKSTIPILPEAAKLLWKEGLQKAVYLYFELGKNNAIVSKMVLLGNHEEWVIDDLSGYLTSVSSRPLANLMTLWVEKHHALYPNVHFQMLLTDTNQVPTMLANGSSFLGLMEREMTTAETAPFIKKYGYSPIGIRVAMTAVALYVHQSNPVKGLTLAQIDAIFSSTGKCSGLKEITTWGQLEFKTSWQNQFKTWVGLEKSQIETDLDWKKLNIQLIGLPDMELNYNFFQEQALCGGEFKNTLNQSNPDTIEIVDLVGETVNSLGFAKLGETAPNVKSLPLQNPTPHWWSSGWVEPTVEEALAGDYPLTRFIWLYINKPSQQPLPVVMNKFFRLIISEDGQKLATQQDFISLSAEFIQEELEKLK